MTLPQFEGARVSVADLIDRILDKGVVINADIKVNVVGVELLDVRIRAAIASFETAAKYGLQFPSGTKLPEWAAPGQVLASTNGAAATAAIGEAGWLEREGSGHAH